jgi:hypothetical protein
MNEKEQLERHVSQSLTQGRMEAPDPEAAARRRLIPRHEIRIQAGTDPIVEETRQFRSMAEEVDGRYDGYMRRAEQRKPNE